MGFIWSMLSWRQLTKFSYWNPPQKIRRHPAVQARYEVLKKEQPNREKYMMSRLFQNNEVVKWMDNEFPAWVEPGVRHNLLWINPKHGRIDDYDLANTMIQVHTDKPFIFWENLPQNKSVPGIQHFHVFINDLIGPQTHPLTKLVQEHTPSVVESSNSTHQ